LLLSKAARDYLFVAKVKMSIEIVLTQLLQYFSIFLAVSRRLIALSAIGKETNFADPIQRVFNILGYRFDVSGNKKIGFLVDYQHSQVQITFYHLCEGLLGQLCLVLFDSN
jgi:hypothetical protein